MGMWILNMIGRSLGSTAGMVTSRLGVNGTILIIGGVVLLLALSGAAKKLLTSPAGIAIVACGVLAALAFAWFTSPKTGLASPSLLAREKADAKKKANWRQENLKAEDALNHAMGLPAGTGDQLVPLPGGYPTLLEYPARKTGRRAGVPSRWAWRWCGERWCELRGSGCRSRTRGEGSICCRGLAVRVCRSQSGNARTGSSSQCGGGQQPGGRVRPGRSENQRQTGPKEPSGGGCWRKGGDRRG